MDNIQKTQKNTFENIYLFKDNVFYYCYQKVKKFASATYLITNFFSEQEPLKWNMRQASANLVKTVMSLSSASLSERESVARRSTTEVFHLIALFDIAFTSGFISKNNHDIISDELKQFANVLSEQSKDTNSVNSIFFNKEYFGSVALTTNSNFQKDQQKEHSHIGQTIDKGQVSYKGQDDVLGQKQIKSIGQLSRREKIIKIIKEKGNVSISDLSKDIKGCSEKTLQRELLAMVSESILSKVGERRWSRYSLL